LISVSRCDSSTPQHTPLVSCQRTKKDAGPERGKCGRQNLGLSPRALRRGLLALQKGGDPAAGSPTATLLTDFAPVTELTLTLPPLRLAHRFRVPPLPWRDGRCVQGPGTYSRGVADPRLLRFRLHAVELQTAIRT